MDTGAFDANEDAIVNTHPVGFFLVAIAAEPV